MKLIFKESSVDYNQYNFGYSMYAILDSLKEIESIFNKGFLDTYLPKNKNPAKSRLMIVGFI